MRAFINQIKTNNPTFGLTGKGRTALTYTLGLVDSGTTSTPPSAPNTVVTCSNIPTYSAGKSDITIIVPFRAFIYSVMSGTAALTISGTTAGDTVNLINNGIIMGVGGAQNSGAGGTALSIGQNTTVNNTATITASGTACSTTARVLTVGGTVTGVFYIGMSLSGTGVTNAPVIVSFGTGSGGAGTYNISTSAALGSRTITGTFSSYIVGGGGGGGTGPNAGTGGGGAGGNSSSAPNTQTATFSGGSGTLGGRQVPGIGGAVSGYTPCVGSATSAYGAGAGGAGGFTGGNGGSGGSGGAGGGANNVGGNGSNTGGWGSGGGGGGWGAAGGLGGLGAAGGTAGKAVALNGNSITWVSSDTTRVWGAIS